VRVEGTKKVRNKGGFKGKRSQETRRKSGQQERSKELNQS
jgi:hypothetical protein